MGSICRDNLSEDQWQIICEVSYIYEQWRIQDFPGAATQRGANLLFGQFFQKKCMRMKKFW